MGLSPVFVCRCCLSGVGWLCLESSGGGSLLQVCLLASLLSIDCRTDPLLPDAPRHMYRYVLLRF